MNIIQHQPVTREDYRIKQEVLRELQVAARAGFIAARDKGDLKGLRHWSEQLEAGVAAFEDFRKKLSPLEQFVVKYNISELGEHQVKLVLPAGVSRIELLQDAQGLSQQYRGQDAVWPNQYKKWEQLAEYKVILPTPTLIMIDGCVDGTLGDSRANQERFLKDKKLKMPTLHDLAVAQVGYFMMSGKDLFCDRWVRAVGGVLYFYSHGLDGGNVGDGSGSNVAASACCPHLR